MAKNTGTLVGAPIRVNDSLDTYPSAVDNELKGGRMSVNTVDDMNGIFADRRSAGMQCYVYATQETYRLKNDLVTWVVDQPSSSGGSTNPGAGGTSADISLISGNFGEWTDPDNKSGEFINEDYPLRFKADLQAFPSRCIVYLQGQFGLTGSFAEPSWVLGNLPVNAQPKNMINKWMVCQNIEMFLQIQPSGATDSEGNDISGQISLVSKDGFNLPTTSGTPEVQPYYVECYFSPVVNLVPPTTYTTTRTASYTKNDCALGNNGSIVEYSQDYTSTVDQATADSLAANDDTFDASGQAYANANGTCTFDPTKNVFVQNNRNSGSAEVIFKDSLGNVTTLGGVPPGGKASAGVITANVPFSIQVVNTNSVQIEASAPSSGALIPPHQSHTFPGQTGFPMIVTLD